MVTPTGWPELHGGHGGVRARIGVLSVQGAYAAHAAVLAAMGATPVAVLEPGDLDGLDGLVLPGGESTTMALLLRSGGLWDALAVFLASGLPVLGTCAGAILVARQILDGRAGQQSLGGADIAVRRNGFGRQVESFETDLAWPDGPPLPAVFIRAPVIERTGPGVQVLARLGESHGHSPVLCRDGHIVIATFHPELTGDQRVHELAFGEVLRQAGQPAPASKARPEQRLTV
ncbi:MAG TPA: pyridoxal 5'-phosphate synthase glutaminase subunit PdxT [Streptosporangiaceae bacterium]|jgi:5'-phosphate synthase pdxT subunit